MTETDTRAATGPRPPQERAGMDAQQLRGRCGGQEFRGTGFAVGRRLHVALDHGGELVYGVRQGQQGFG
jgi:hypothetical protein